MKLGLSLNRTSTHDCGLYRWENRPYKRRGKEKAYGKDIDEKGDEIRTTEIRRELFSVVDMQVVRSH